MGQAVAMPREIIVITGLPGAGKTTLARQLAGVLDVAVITRDTIKEAAAEAIPDWPERLPDLPDLLGGVSYEVMYALARGIPGTIILESNFGPGSVTDLHELASDRLVQILCECPLAVALERYNTRARHAIHRHPVVDGPTLLSLGPTEPLSLDGPCIRVDSAEQVDAVDLGRRIGHLLGR